VASNAVDVVVVMVVVVAVVVIETSKMSTGSMMAGCFGHGKSFVVYIQIGVINVFVVVVVVLL
jgi:hypothetical protein